MPNIWLFRIVRLLASLISHLYFRVEYQGVENIPTSGPFLMTPNHVSYFDPIWISVPVRRPIRYMTWDVMTRKPVIGPLMRAFGSFPVNIERADRQALRTAADQLRQWITENRLNRFSPARAEGEATWKTLGDLPEFADLLGGPAPIAMPTATSTSPTRPASSQGGWASPSAPSGSGLRSAPGISETVVDEKLRIPAIGILTTGAVGTMLSFYGLVSGLSENARQEIPPGMPPEFERMFKAYLAFAEAYVVPLNALALVLSLLSLLAGVRMLQRKSYGLVMAGVILATIPCVSPCCCLGLPFGIWALVVLSNTEVKAAFR